ncbi:hypothetical protein ALQ60_200271 [Pseudomonas syringae pv. papulans]|nr:hypothetical protein ALQ60_200271 [Pseudomonas syringae pv. papulans]
MLAPAGILEVDRQVVEAGDHHGVDREERHAEARQTAIGRDDLSVFDAFFLGWQIALFGVQLGFVSRQQVTADDCDQVAAITNALVDHLLGVMHQGVEVGIVTTFAQRHLSSDLAFLENLLRDLFASDLQPALVHVLQHREFSEVGLRRGFETVETDHQTVECDLLLHGSGVTLLEVRELGPGVDLRVRQADIGLGGVQLVSAVIQRGRVLGFAIGGLGVGATGHRTRHAEEHLLTLDLAYADDVDAL